MQARRKWTFRHRSGRRQLVYLEISGCCSQKYGTLQRWLKTTAGEDGLLAVQCGFLVSVFLNQYCMLT